MDLRSYFLDLLGPPPPAPALADLLAAVPAEFHAALRRYFERTEDFHTAAQIK